MGMHRAKGFTIIETTLFLGISGILVILLVIGAGTSLNGQRYRDATEAFRSLIQDQYVELSNIQNSRDDNWSCNRNAIATTGGAVAPGQSDCLLIGKYVYISNQDVSIYPVLAYTDSTNLFNVVADDLTALKNNYRMSASPSDLEQRKLEWGTNIAWAKTGVDAKSPRTPRQIGILIIRSPESGHIYTLTSDAPVSGAVRQATFDDLLTIKNQSARTICLASAGLTTRETGVNIARGATTTSAVTLLGDSTQC